MKLPTIPPGLAGKIVKYRPLSEPIRLQDLEDSARSQAWKKIKNGIKFRVFNFRAIFDLPVLNFANFLKSQKSRNLVRIRYMLIIKTVLCITRLMPKVSFKLTFQIILSDVLFSAGNIDMLSTERFLTFKKERFDNEASALARLTFYENLIVDLARKKCPLSALTGVHIKRTVSQTLEFTVLYPYITNLHKYHVC